jgi:hypothetical protein
MRKYRTTALAGFGVAVAIGTLVVAAPAYAAEKVDVSVIAPGTFNPGDTQLLNIEVTNKTNGPLTVVVSVSGLDNFTVSDPRGCTGSPNGCTVTFGVDDSTKQVSFSMKATGTPDAGQQQTDRGRVTARAPGNDTATDNFDATVKAQPQSPTVTQISGSVRDQTTGIALKGATVAIQDGGACGPGRCETGTDNNGQFRFTSRPDRPITPGSIQIGARKTGYEIATQSLDARAGQSLNVTLKLKASADATASASAEPLPTLDALQPTGAAEAPTGGAAQRNVSDSGPSTLSWIVMILAGLLVLAGVGVFVVLFLNRKKGDEDPDNDPAGNRPTGPPARYGGAPEATMVGRPAGMTQAGMPVPGAGDAATAILHAQRPEDEYPDPYAAPRSAGPPNYPPAGAGYGNPPAGAGYGNDNGYGQQAGYGATAAPAGYDPQRGYGGTPTAYGTPAPPTVYPPPPTGYPPTPPTTPTTYGPPAPQDPYGAPPPGYDQQRGYDQPEDYDQSGYGRQGGYSAAPPPPTPPQRYDEATRQWDGGDYPPARANAGPQQPGNYPPGYDNPGYEQPAGYDPYYQPPPPTDHPGARPPTGRANDRQRLDWLDD